MSRINTNISSLQAIHTLTRNQNELSTHLQRLSTGLRINTGKAAPAALIASETLRSEISGIHQAIDNSTRAGNVVATAIASFQINSSKIPDNGYVSVIVQVVGSAQLAQLSFAASGIDSTPVTLEIAGNDGTEQLSFAASTHNSAILVAINQLKQATGVSATLSGAALKITSTAYGARQFVSVSTLAGTFLNGKDYGQDAQVNVNGAKAETDGLTASVRSDNLDVKFDLTALFGTTVSPTGTTFQITGGGARFQLGSQVNRQGQVNIGIGAVATTHLGNAIDGYLSALGSGGGNSLVSGNLIQSQRILTAAIR